MPQLSVLDPNDFKTIEEVAQWYFDEWGAPKERTQKRLSFPSDSDTLFQVVAFEQGEPVCSGGVANLVNIYKEHPRLESLAPWISSIVTKQGHRGKGLGESVLKFIESEARRRGISRLHLYTYSAESMYARNGWRAVERVVYKGEPTVVMVKEIFNPD